MLRKGKDLFHRHLSEDLEGAHSKTKLAKIVVECRKEGNVNYTILDSQEHLGGTPLKWDKCRLALVKAVGGYMLEFYTPPKSTKVRFGLRDVCPAKKIFSYYIIINVGNPVYCCIFFSKTKQDTKIIIYIHTKNLSFCSLTAKMWRFLCSNFGSTRNNSFRNARSRKYFCLERPE